MARTVDSDKDAAREELKLYAQTDTQPALGATEVDAILVGVQRATFWLTATAYNINDVILPATMSGRRYRCVRTGTSGATEPSWPKSSGSVIGDGDGDLLWMEDGPEYANVFDIRAAIHQAWMTKAAKASPLFDTRSSSQGYSQSQIYQHCMDMAERYAPIGIA